MSEGTPAVHGLPTWLRASFSSCFPQDWCPIATGFMRLMERALEAQGLTSAVVTFFEDEGMLRIRIAACPTLPRRRSEALRRSADQFEALAATAQRKRNEASEAEASDMKSLVNDYFDQHESRTKVCVNDKIPLALGLDDGNDASAEVVDDAQFIGLPVRVFYGLSTPRANDAATATRDSDTSKRLSETMRRLRFLGPLRPLKSPVDDWQARLDSLERKFENFQQVVRAVVRPHAFLISKGVHHRMSPILLLGPPGIGKTQFTRELQDILAVPTLFISMAAETNGSRLQGSSIFWGNASPGSVFEQAAWGCPDAPGGIANFIVAIDEVDKAGSMQYDPLAGLYALLEVETARRFEDQAVPGVAMDLSRIRIVLTANDLGPIPTPLLSRVTTFHIDAPGPEATRRIVQAIFVSILEKLSLDFDPILEPAVLDEAAGMSPREAKTRLETAVAIAACAGKRTLDLASWRYTNGGVTNRPRRIGYM